MLNLSASRFYRPSTDRIEWLISSTRVVLVGFWLLAAYFDPFEEPRYSESVGEVLIVYLFISAVIAGAAFAGLTNRIWQAVVHSTDIAIISLLLYLTQGPLSPFFLFFSFVMFSGTLRWSWRGAALTALLLFMATGLLAWEIWTVSEARDDFEWNRILLRMAFLAMSGVMLMWFGYAHETASLRLSRLAAWPSPASAEEDRTAETPLAATLAHIGKVMNAPRVLVWCKWRDKPETETWLWTIDALHHDRRAGRQSDTFLVAGDGAEAAGARVDRADTTQELDRRHATLSAEFASNLVAGGISLPDRSAWSADESFMMDIIVSRVRLELEHQQLRQEHETIAGLRERARLARDLHDGALQTLTASRLQLSEITSDNLANAPMIIQNVSKMLQEEQGRLRQFRLHLLAPPSIAEVSLTQLQAEIVARQQRLWLCSVTADVTPSTATVPNNLGAELTLLISEAVGNAVRHGKATEVRITIAKKSDRLLLEICDNGRGLPGREGMFGHEELSASRIGPASLLARTESLGGSMRLNASSNGVALLIEIPLPASSS